MTEEKTRNEVICNCWMDEWMNAMNENFKKCKWLTLLNIFQKNWNSNFQKLFPHHLQLKKGHAVTPMNM